MNNAYEEKKEVAMTMKKAEEGENEK